MVSKKFMQGSSPIKRASFTPAQKRAAQELGFITDHDRATRRRIRAHAIDNVRPEIKADRDDALYVSTNPMGDGYLIEGTIADVAGTVPLGSPLSAVGHTRAYTRYREFWNDPMFPKYLEDRMSLEHGKERRGLTVKSWRNPQYDTNHLEFERTLSVGDNVDYAMAQERIDRQEPQFLLMQKIGKGLRARMKSRVPEAVADAKRARQDYLPEQAIETRKMVEAYMLSINEDVASFMVKAKLPYIFRNFDDNDVGPDGIARAYYSVHSKRHDALQRDGLTGNYGHFTSPIRRGADFYNAHMVHYVIDCVENLERDLLAAAPQLDKDALHYQLWEHIADMLALQSQRGSASSPRLWAKMQQHFQDCLPPGVEMPLLEISHRFLKLRPPLTHSQLERYVSHINALNALEQGALQAPDIQRWLKDREAARSDDDERLALGKLSREQISLRPPADFTLLLRKAAKQGTMTEALRDETIARLSLSHDHAGLTRRLTQDAFSILVVAPQNDEWQPLKAAACSAIKNNPDVVNSVLDLARQEEYLDAQSMHLSRANLSTGRDAMINRSNSIEAALLTYRLPDGTVVAPPYLSVGHDVRSAKSHADYSFLERYAFGELRPVDQANIPPLLYADLDHPEADRRAIVERMVKEIGAEFRTVESVDSQGVRYVEAIAEGGGFSEPLVGRAHAGESAEPTNLAIKRLLRQDAFKDTLIFPQLAEVRSSLRPMEKLQQRVAEHGFTMHEITQPRTGSSRSQYLTTITIVQNGKETTYTDSGPNIHRARHAAAVKALQQRGWGQATPSPAPTKSWVADAATPPLANSLSADR